MKLVTIAMVGAMALLAACSGDDAATTGTDASATAGASSSGPAPNTVEYFNMVVGDRVFFDTDQYDLNSEAQFVLQKQAQWFAANPGTNATIEGHADERGTREYNLGLGERRGNAVEALMVAQGAGSNQLTVVSYGEERPVCRVSDEECWSLNRRVEIVYTAK